MDEWKHEISGAQLALGGDWNAAIQKSGKKGYMIIVGGPVDGDGQTSVTASSFADSIEEAKAKATGLAERMRRAFPIV